MPTVARFQGLVVRMYYDDHPPPHFHVAWEDSEVSFSIRGQLIEGEVSPNVTRLVRRWAFTHRKELFENWFRARRRETLVRIPGHY